MRMQPYREYPAFTSRHDFRRNLPDGVLYVEEPEAEDESRWSMDDVRLFFMSFTACFLAVSAFIA